MLCYGSTLGFGVIDWGLGVGFGEKVDVVFAAGVGVPGFVACTEGFDAGFAVEGLLTGAEGSFVAFLGGVLSVFAAGFTVSALKLSFFSTCLVLSFGSSGATDSSTSDCTISVGLDSSSKCSSYCSSGALTVSSTTPSSSKSDRRACCFEKFACGLLPLSLFFPASFFGFFADEWLYLSRISKLSREDDCDFYFGLDSWTFSSSSPIKLSL